MGGREAHSNFTVPMCKSELECFCVTLAWGKRDVADTTVVFKCSILKECKSIAL